MQNFTDFYSSQIYEKALKIENNPSLVRLILDFQDFLNIFKTGLYR